MKRRYKRSPAPPDPRSLPPGLGASREGGNGGPVKVVAVIVGQGFAWGGRRGRGYRGAARQGGRGAAALPCPAAHCMQAATLLAIFN